MAALGAKVLDRFLLLRNGSDYAAIRASYISYSKKDRRITAVGLSGIDR